VKQLRKKERKYDNYQIQNSNSHSHSKVKQSKVTKKLIKRKVNIKNMAMGMIKLKKGIKNKNKGIVNMDWKLEGNEKIESRNT